MRERSARGYNVWNFHDRSTAHFPRLPNELGLWLIFTGILVDASPLRKKRERERERNGLRAQVVHLTDGPSRGPRGQFE